MDLPYTSFLFFFFFFILFLSFLSLGLILLLKALAQRFLGG